MQASWTNASKKQREKLLELIRRLAEDDKDGVMAHKVLNLLWNLAHSDDVPVDIMDQALSAHIKILDYSCSQVSASVGLDMSGIRGRPVNSIMSVMGGGGGSSFKSVNIDDVHSWSLAGQRHSEDSVDRSLHRGVAYQRQMGDPCPKADQRDL